MQPLCGSTWRFLASVRAPCASSTTAPFVSAPRRLPAGAFREFAPAVVLSILDPKLTWSEAESAAAVAAGVVVHKPGGEGLSPYDLKRLQVGAAVFARRAGLRVAGAEHATLH